MVTQFGIAQFTQYPVANQNYGNVQTYPGAQQQYIFGGQPQQQIYGGNNQMQAAQGNQMLTSMLMQLIFSVLSMFMQKASNTKSLIQRPMLQQPVQQQPVQQYQQVAANPVIDNPVKAFFSNLLGLDKQVSAQKAVDTTQNETIKKQDAKLTDLDTKLKNAEAKTVEQSEEINNLRKDITDLKALLTQNVQGIESKINVVENKVKDINTKDIQQDSAIAAGAAKDTQQDSQIAAGVTKDSQQDSQIAAGTAKDAQQDSQITAGVTKDAQQDSAIAAGVTKDSQQDSKIAAGITKDAQQDSTIASNYNLINTRWRSTFGFDLNGTRVNVDPLVLDTNKDGKISTQEGTGVKLDDNGTTGAAVGGDKMLALTDQNNNGQIDAAEVFGTDTLNPFTGQKVNARNGFEALKEIAESAEKITGIDVIQNGVVSLTKLQEALNTTGTKLGLISDNNTSNIEDLGDIEKIDANYEETPTDGMNLQVGSYINKAGERFRTEDVWFTAK